jgi:hypothetical protein
LEQGHQRPSGTTTYARDEINHIGKVYSGRTSGYGTPRENITARDAYHHLNKKGFGPAVLDQTSTNYAAIRGREQQLIKANGGAKSTGGTSGNAINGISAFNFKKAHYLKEAIAAFGKLGL